MNQKEIEIRNLIAKKHEEIAELETLLNPDIEVINVTAKPVTCGSLLTLSEKASYIKIHTSFGESDQFIRESLNLNIEQQQFIESNLTHCLLCDIVLKLNSHIQEDELIDWLNITHHDLYECLETIKLWDKIK